MTNDGPGAAYRSISPRSSRFRRALLWGLCLSLLASAAMAAGLPFKNKFPFAAGDTVLVEGVVSDSLGRPLPNLEVILEISKLRLSLRPPGKEKRNISRGATTTDAAGHFGLEWQWQPGFDRFEVIAAAYVPRPGGKGLEVLVRLDITDHVRQGSPIDVPVLLEDTSLLDEMALLQEHLQSIDGQRVYEAHGRPDRIDSDDYPGKTLSSWWYFTLGKVYRFDDGRLIETETFEPVEPI